MRVQNLPLLLLSVILLLASKPSIASLYQSFDADLTTDSQSIAQTQHSQQLSPIPILEKDSQEDTTLQKDNLKEFEQVVTELRQLRKELSPHIELISNDEIKRIINQNSFLTYILINNFIRTSPLKHMQFEQDLSRNILKNRLGLNNETLELSKDLLKPVLVGTAIAIPAGYYAMNKWLEGFAYRISFHWWIFAIAVVVSVAIALLTVGLQASKAALANPIKSLRTE